MSDIVLPAGSWLQRYVEVHGGLAPDIYNLGVGLAVLATTCPSSYASASSTGLVVPNLYCLLVGPPARHKTSAVRTGVDVLRRAAYDRLVVSVQSAEGLFAAMCEGPVLGLVNEGALWEPQVQSFVIGVWQGASQSRVTKRGTTQIEAPRLNLLGETTRPLLKKWAGAESFTGGFFSRWLVLDATDLEWRPPKTDTIVEVFRHPLYAGLIADLKVMCAIEAHTIQAAPGMLPAEADEIWRAWAASVVRPAGPAYRLDALVFAWKLATILAWDLGLPRRGGPWAFTVEVIELAIALTELHLANVARLFDLGDSSSGVEVAP